MTIPGTNISIPIGGSISNLTNQQHGNAVTTTATSQQNPQVVASNMKTENQNANSQQSASQQTNQTQQQQQQQQHGNAQQTQQATSQSQIATQQGHHQATITIPGTNIQLPASSLTNANGLLGANQNISLRLENGLTTGKLLLIIILE